MKPEPTDLPSFSVPGVDDVPYPSLMPPTGPQRSPGRDSSRPRRNRPGSDGSINGITLDADLSLANQLILLVSKLEYQRAQLAALEGKGQPATALQALREVLDEVGAVAEAVLKTDSAVGLKSDLVELKNALRTLEERLPKSTLRTVLGFFQSTGLTGSKDRMAVRQLAGRVQSLLEDYFNRFKYRFVAPGASAQWSQTAELFLNEFRTVTERLL